MQPIIAKKAKKKQFNVFDRIVKHEKAAKQAAFYNVLLAQYIFTVVVILKNILLYLIY